MQFLIDNLLATIIATTIFLILVSATLHSQMRNIEMNNLYGLKKQELNFIELLKRDLHGVSKVDNVTETSIDSSFTFYAQLDNANPIHIPVKYKRIKVGMRGDVPLYQIKRFESGVPAGASMVTVTSWVIEARNSEGGAITDPEDAGQVYVRFEAAAPWKDDETVKRTRWEATFRPPLLSNNVLL